MPEPMTTPQPAAPLSDAEFESYRRCLEVYDAATAGDRHVGVSIEGGSAAVEAAKALIFNAPNIIRDLLAEVQRLRSEVAEARNVTLREVLAYEAGQAASVPADLEAAVVKAPGRYCCLPDCPKLAEFEIYDGPEPDNGTDACIDHVGHLLKDKVSYVYPISTEPKR